MVMYYIDYDNLPPACRFFRLHKSVLDYFHKLGSFLPQSTERDSCYLRRGSRCENHYAANEITSILLRGETKEEKDLLAEQLYLNAHGWQIDAITYAKKLRDFNDQNMKVKDLADYVKCMQKLLDLSNKKVMQLEKENTKLTDALEAREAENGAMMKDMQKNGSIITRLQDQVTGLEQQVGLAVAERNKLRAILEQDAQTSPRNQSWSSPSNKRPARAREGGREIIGLPGAAPKVQILKIRDEQIPKEVKKTDE